MFGNSALAPRIAQLARTANDLLEYCESDTISEEGIHEIIQSHKESTPDDNHEVSDYEFFHWACRNEKVTEGKIQRLLEYFPAAVNYPDSGCRLPLHSACENKHVSIGIIRQLIDAAPNSVRHTDNFGYMPLHCLCYNKGLNETTATEILKLLLEKYPESVRHARRDYLISNDSHLPIHIAAAMMNSPAFCRVLIEAYPGSERIATNVMGALPIHRACMYNTVETVEYLYNLYPDAINCASQGWYPIHFALKSVTQRPANPESAVDIVKFLLDCDPRVKFLKVQGIVHSLELACYPDYNHINISPGMEIIGAIYDANPEAIEENRIEGGIQTCHQLVQAFIEDQLVYSRQAKDERAMTTPNEYGRLRLHTALKHNVRLGSIKLLVKGNPLALRYPDNRGAFPLHLSCLHHESASVVQYLIELDTTTLEAVDDDGDTALHYACYGVKYDTIALLLDKYDAMSVSKRNNRKMLPIEVLWENHRVDRESVEYTECVFQLLRAYPETVMNCMSMRL